MRKIIFHAEAGDAGNPIEHVSDPSEWEDGVTDKELELEAEQFMWEMVRPEFWWEEVDD